MSAMLRKRRMVVKIAPVAMGHKQKSSSFPAKLPCDRECS